MTQETTWAIREDRELHVRPDQVVRTAWVPLDDCILGSRYRRSVGDVERKYQKLLQMGDSQPWPPILGEWRGERFVIGDGGHTFIALQMLGRDSAFVAWLEGA